MRHPAFFALALLFTHACTQPGAAVSFAIPTATAQALTGFDAGGRALVALAVVCDDGRRSDHQHELATREESVAFFVPACGQATLSLTISAIYDGQEPVVAFEASSTAFLESGVNTDVAFSGVAYGELVLDPLGQPILRCTYEDVGGLYGLQSVDMSTAAVVLRVPAADYDVYCFDQLNTLPNYQPTRVGAGQRVGPDLTLNPDTHEPPPPPVLEDLMFFSITQTSVFVSWGFSTFSIATISFTIEIAIDPAFAQQVRTPVVTDVGQHDFTGLSPSTHYYVRVVATDEWGTSNTLVGELDTASPPGSPYLASILVNGQPLPGFSSTQFGYGYNAQSSDDTLTFEATTLDATSYVRVESDAEGLGSTTSVQPIPFGTTQIDIFARNADGSFAQSYAISVFRPPT